MQVKDLFEIYQTKDLNHPGIKKEKLKSPFKIAGKIQLREEIYQDSLYKNILQDVFNKKNKEVKTIAGFQTRNAIHKAHEHLQKIALELCDALFINPLIGWKKEGDFTQEAVMSAYKIMFEEFYPKNRVFIQGLETNMRYAGPKEAIFHAIIRKNAGCTHFIIGRDHAGVGDYYGVYETHKLEKELNSANELGIELLLLKEPYFCSKCQEIVSEKVCSHKDTHKISISGTKIRKALISGEIPDERFMRKEVAQALINLGVSNIFIKDKMQKYILTVGPSLDNKFKINKIHQDNFIYRINGAHGNLEDIKNTIFNISNQNKSAKILIDLPGNKIRTANISEPIQFSKIKILP